MFNFLKANPQKKLTKEYDLLLEKAMQAQRNGDIRLYAELTAEAEVIKAQLEEMATLLTK
ncbi:DUF6435 family protein [Marinomonas sp. THO17]|uniref:DUF6435 family protein n=1 Tax=Marinomonas sp. THO17 TaxID=3149048 RepID=UPI00336BFB30